MNGKKSSCIHGHFYQPPREDPWTELEPPEESAAPYHDWNERILDECYGPNAASQILDSSGRIRAIVNNYESISFNFGPTLLSWMEPRHPSIYAAILDADRKSAARRGGHGNAIAQAYNHMILPLAGWRDKLTQIRWGAQDFERRFGRRAEGMWLPETAVDDETLEALISERVAFTILAPHQAKAVRPLAGGSWGQVNESSFDPSRVYRWNSRRAPGRYIDLFFYNRTLSQGVAFQSLLNDGAGFADAFASAAQKEKRAELISIATDGESYGHHHRFGNMALSFAIERLNNGLSLPLTNYGEYLASHPPTLEVEIVSPSAWSCSHGVGRWSRDCGCAIQPGKGWHQAWREPLRQALDWLAARLDEFYQAKVASLGEDPWLTRDKYIHVLGGKASLAQPLKDLCEMQRMRMLMFTSCGWFFDDISGIESVLILSKAARAIELARICGYPEGPKLAEDFTKLLERCPSNRPEFGNGAQVFKILAKKSEAVRLRALSRQPQKLLETALSRPGGPETTKLLALLRSDVAKRAPFPLWELQWIYWKHRLAGGKESPELAEALNFAVPAVKEA